MAGSVKTDFLEVWNSMKIHDRNLQLDCHAVMLSCCHAVAALTKDLFVAEPSPSILEKLPRTTQEFLVFGKIPEVEQVEQVTWPVYHLCELELNCKNIVTASTTAISTHILKHYRITHPWRFLWHTDKYIDIQLQFIICYVAPCVTRFLLLPVPLLTVPRYCGTWVQYASEVLHHLNEEDSGENSAELFFHMRRGDCFRLLHTMGAKHHRHVCRHL